MEARARSTRMGGAAALLLAAFLGSCASYAGIRYMPPVQDVQLAGDPGQGTQARVTVAWRGIHRVEREGADGYEIAFRLRFDNPEPQPFSLAGLHLELLDGALRAFGPPRMDALPEAVLPGANALFDVAFPVPDGKTPDDFELDTLHLAAAIQDGRWSWSSTFQRVVYDPYYDPYWDTHLSLGVFWCD